MTAFKKRSEYAIILLLLASAVFLVRARSHFEPGTLRLLIASVVVTALSETAFSTYRRMDDFLNMAGHMLKILSFYLVYKAIIETAFVRPYDLLFRTLAQSEDALKRYAMQLHQDNEALDAFADSVAHDIRSPLAGVVAFSGELARRYRRMSQDDVEALLNLVEEGGRKASRIVDSLLLLARVRKTDVRTTPLDMSRIVREARMRLTREIDQSGARIREPGSWPPAVGYAPWIEEVLYNYLSNALKYGGQPPVVELGAEPDEDGMIRFWVRDNGSGLTVEEQSRLFTPFTRLDRHAGKGHGLGLSISKRIVEKLGGRCAVTSRPGEGSTFSFTLPARKT